MKWRIFSFCIATIFFTAHADPILVHNTTDRDLWTAPYYVYGGKAYRTEKPIFVGDADSVHIERPDWNVYRDRVLTFDEDRTLLVDYTSSADLYRVNSMDLGFLKGDEFFIEKTEDGFKGHSWMHWKLMMLFQGNYDAIKAVAAQMIRWHLKQSQPAILENPYKESEAHVRIGNDLLEAEREYQINREQHVRRAIEELLGESIGDRPVPTIAIAASGGGYRATIGSLGSMIGAQKAGLLDAVTYLCTLSGSTWMSASWFESGVSLEELKQELKSKVSKGPEEITKKELKLIVDAILVKFAYGQPITIVDLYGALLANRLFNDHDQMIQRVHLSDHAQKLQDAAYPFPIYTTINAVEGSDFDSWYELTPFEAGGAWLNAYAPIWAYGRRFMNGESIDFAPEQSLGFFLGACGSAFAARVDQIYSAIKDRIPYERLRTIIEEKIVELFGHKRLLPAAQVFNFALGIDNSPLEHARDIEMVDGGAWPGFNLPYPPVSDDRPERKADIIIFLDHSVAMIGAHELLMAQEYAYQKGYDFPAIDLKKAEENVITVFKDEKNPYAPIVIYMPLINDPLLWNELKYDPRYAPYDIIEDFDVAYETNHGYANTFRMSHTPEQVEQLSSLTEFNMRVSSDAIVDAIRAFYKIQGDPL